MSKRDWIKLIVTVAVITIVAILIYIRLYPPNQWGLGEFKQLQRFCCWRQVGGLGASPKVGEKGSFRIWL